MPPPSRRSVMVSAHRSDAVAQCSPPNGRISRRPRRQTFLVVVVVVVVGVCLPISKKGVRELEHQMARKRSILSSRMSGPPVFSYSANLSDAAALTAKQKRQAEIRARLSGPHVELRCVVYNTTCASARLEGTLRTQPPQEKYLPRSAAGHDHLSHTSTSANDRSGPPKTNIKHLDALAHGKPCIGKLPCIGHPRPLDKGFARFARAGHGKFFFAASRAEVRESRASVGRLRTNATKNDVRASYALR